MYLTTPYFYNRFKELPSFSHSFGDIYDDLSWFPFIIKTGIYDYFFFDFLILYSKSKFFVIPVISSNIYRVLEKQLKFGYETWNKSPNYKIISTSCDTPKLKASLKFLYESSY